VVFGTRTSDIAAWMGWQLSNIPFEIFFFHSIDEDIQRCIIDICSYGVLFFVIFSGHIDENVGRKCSTTTDGYDKKQANQKR